MTVYVIVEQQGDDYYAIKNNGVTYPMCDIDSNSWTLFTDLRAVEEVLKTVNTNFPNHDGFRGIVEVEV